MYYLNGSYISGYSSKDKKPFDELGLRIDAEKDVNDYLDIKENIENKLIVEKTKSFLSGFYASFGLELLSTVDYIMEEKNTNSIPEIATYLDNWRNRKKAMFNNPKFITIAVKNIERHLPLKIPNLLNS